MVRGGHKNAGNYAKPDIKMTIRHGRDTGSAGNRTHDMVNEGTDDY